VILASAAVAEGDSTRAGIANATGLLMWQAQFEGSAPAVQRRH
jgi:hypothetical protein